MPVNEAAVLLQRKNSTGSMDIYYPVTKSEHVLGLDETIQNCAKTEAVQDMIYAKIIEPETDLDDLWVMKNHKSSWSCHDDTTIGSLKNCPVDSPFRLEFIPIDQSSTPSGVQKVYPAYDSQVYYRNGTKTIGDMHWTPWLKIPAIAKDTLCLTTADKSKAYYASCSTSGATAAKVVGLSGYSLLSGNVIGVRFTQKNTAKNPTLNVGGTGAKPIVDHTNTNIKPYMLQAIMVAYLMYDGTSWRLLNPAFVDEYTTSPSSGKRIYSDGHVEKWGAIPVPSTLNTVDSIQVTFSQTFASKPSVTVTPITKSPHTISVSPSDVSTTGFTCNVYQTDAQATALEWHVKGKLNDY